MSQQPEGPQDNKARGYVGLATFCCLLLTGVGGLGIGLAALFDKGDYTAAGLFWLAASISFGLLLNAFLRK
jgi:hypothetical protein